MIGDRIAKPSKCLLEAASVREAVYENMLHKMYIILLVVLGHPGERGVKVQISYCDSDSNCKMYTLDYGVLIAIYNLKATVSIVLCVC